MSRAARRAPLTPLAVAVVALLAACGGEPDPVGARSLSIRPTDGSGWNNNGYESGAKVEHWDTPGGSFRIHYTRSTDDAVPAADADSDNVPDFVEQFGRTFDRVLERLEALGFKPPLSDATHHDRPDYGGDGRFDVYLLDQNGKSDGYVVKEACTNTTPSRCAGYMVVENDFKGYSYKTVKDGMEILASHEFFHAVQHGYATGLSGALSEGSAVWFTEQVFAAQRDFEGFARYFFREPQRPIDDRSRTPSDLYVYGTAMWPQFLGEQFGTKVVSELLAELAKGSAKSELDAIDRVLERDHKSSLARAFSSFALWNYFTGDRASDHESYAKAADYPQLKLEAIDKKDPFRITGEIAYLSAHYYRVAIPEGTRIEVRSEYQQPKLALHLITGSGKQTEVASAAPGADPPTITSAGKVVIVAASTALRDKHLPLSLAVRAVATKGSDGGSKPNGDAPKDESSGCAVSGLGGSSRTAGLPTACLLLLVVLLLRERSTPRRLRRPLALTLIAALLGGFAGCSDGGAEHADGGGADGADSQPADARGDGPSGLALGGFVDFEADKKGVIRGTQELAGGEKFLLLLTSAAREARVQRDYKVVSTRTTTRSSSSVPPRYEGGGWSRRAPQPGLELATRCDFARRLGRVLGSASGPLEPLAPPANAMGAPPNKGDKRSFSIRVSGTTHKITAEAIHVDKVATFWIDRTTTPAATIKTAVLTELADGFAKTVVPRERIYFGKESDVDGDGQISVLLSPLVSKSAVAYVSPCDLVDPKKITGCAVSNHAELIYLSPPNTLTSSYATPKAMLETIAHEFQHAIYFHRKYLLNKSSAPAGENPYVTEALSHLAQDLTGYQAGNFYVLLATLKSIDLVSIPNLADAEISSYVPKPADGVLRGAGYLLLRYLFDQAGGDAMDKSGTPQDKGGIAWLHKLIDQPETGVASILKASSMSYAQLTSRFWTALAVSNRRSGGELVNRDKRYAYLPTTTDPLTQRTRGCDLFLSFHASSLTGPATQDIEKADGKLRPGGGELLTLTPDKGDQLELQLTTDPRAKAKARLIRVR